MIHDIRLRIEDLYPYFFNSGSIRLHLLKQGFFTQFFGLFLSYILNFTKNSISTSKRTTYGDYVFPWWGESIGIMMAASSIFCIPVYFAYAVYTAPGLTYREVFKIDFK